MGHAAEAIARKVRTFSRLERPDRTLLLHACVLIPLVRMALGVARFQTVSAGLTRLGGRVPAPRTNALSAARRVSRVVDMAARHTVWSSSCLHRSTVLWWLLRRQGLGGLLRFGVRRHRGGFEAHAWVEYEGTVLNETPAGVEAYVALPDLPVDAQFSS